jgi:hypothetical protein
MTNLKYRFLTPKQYFILTQNNTNVLSIILNVSILLVLWVVSKTVTKQNPDANSDQTILFKFNILS